MISTTFLKNSFKFDYFNSELPPLRWKHSAFDIEDVPGLWRVHWQLGNTILFSSFYTRIDQACLLWGIISALIFITAQFSDWDWGTQAWLWSGLTIAGSIGTALMAPYWLRVKPLSRTFLVWVILMVLGTGITDLSICWGWSNVLIQLCPLWLALTALGYLYTGIEMRSRGFLIITLLPALGIFLMPYLGVWQFSATGLLIGFSMVLMAELQWDSSGVCATHKTDIRSDRDLL